jgi:hypothetical protein
MLIESGYHCATCGEWNTASVDTEAGNDQHYIEDCFVCCHPNMLSIRVNSEDHSAWIEAQFEE